MITKEKVIEIVTKYLKDRNRNYMTLNIEKIFFEEKDIIEYGKYEDEKRDTYTISYDVESYQQPIKYFVRVDAETGEVLFTASPHGYVEEWEE
jgi:Peptidase propeptide and YPEB domain